MGKKAALRGKTLAQQNALLIPPGVNAKKKAPPALDTSSFERWVQSGLNALGSAHDFLPAPLDVDGKLGRRSRAAVRAFQRHAKEIIHKGLAVDGIVGQHTVEGLELGTGASAPTVKEKDRRPPVQAPANTKLETKAEVPGTDAKGGAIAGGGGGSPTPAVAPKKTATDGGKVAERPADGDAKAHLAAGKDDEAKDDAARGKTVASGAKGAASAPRTGEAGRADELRRRWPKGMLVSLSIPPAYDSPADAIEYVEGGHALDSYAYRVHYPKWAAAHPCAIQAQWAAIRPPNSPLPAKYADATPKQKKRILAAVQGRRSSYDAVKAQMWKDPGWRQKLAKTAYGNNKYIPNSTASFAKAQGAVAAEGGSVQIGKSMLYHKPAELSSKVVATAKAAAALLAAHPPASGPTVAEDAQVAKVRFLTIAAHGWPTGMGGHGAAHSARFSKRQVPKLVSDMASVLSGDVRVRLFACKTSRVKGSQDSEGSIGDAFRDALLAEGKEDGAVIGHTESGDTQRNSATRFMKADEGTGHLDWRYGTVFDADFRRAWLEKMGARSTKATRAAARSAMQAFFGREGWMEDITDEAALRESVRARWNARYPDAASLPAKLRKKLGIRPPHRGEGGGKA